MKTRILGMLGILFIGIVAFISACSSNNMPVTTTTYSNGTGGTGPSSTPIPTAVPTPKPVYYYSVYYTVSCVGGCGSQSAVDYTEPSGSIIYIPNPVFPYTSPTMTFSSGENLYIYGTLSGTVIVNIYVNGSLVQSNSGVSDAVATGTLS